MQLHVCKGLQCKVIIHSLKKTESTAIYLCNWHTLLTNDPGQLGECVNVKKKGKQEKKNLYFQWEITW